MEREQQDLQLYNLTRKATRPPGRVLSREKVLESYFWKLLELQVSGCQK